MENRNRIAPERLLDFATAAHVQAGMPEAGARLVADTLVQADLWGHQSHPKRSAAALAGTPATGAPCISGPPRC